MLKVILLEIVEIVEENFGFLIFICDGVWIFIFLLIIFCSNFFIFSKFVDLLVIINFLFIFVSFSFCKMLKILKNIFLIFCLIKLFKFFWVYWICLFELIWFIEKIFWFEVEL